MGYMCAYDNCQNQVRVQGTSATEHEGWTTINSGDAVFCSASADGPPPPSPPTMCCPAPPRHALGGSDGGGWTVNVVKFILAEEGYTCANACACQGLSCDDGHWGIYDERTFRSNLQAALNLDRVHAEDMCRSGYAPSASASAPLLHTGQSHECNFAPGNTQCDAPVDGFPPGTRRLCQCIG